MTYSPIVSLISIFKSIFQFNIDKYKLSKYFHQGEGLSFWLSRSAWSLAIITNERRKVKTQGIINIWVPDYFCNESLNILRLIDCKIIFYPILENLEPDYPKLNSLLNDKGIPDLFIHVHYFGIPISTSKSVEFCKKYGAWLIEDAAHVLKQIKGIGEAGDFVLYSPHKLLPIPNGALLITRANGPSSLNLNLFEKEFSNKKFENIYTNNIKNKYNYFKHQFSNYFWILKQVLQNFRIRNNVTYDFKQTEITISNKLSYPIISRISLSILNILVHKLNHIALIRERNQILWDNYFTTIYENKTYIKLGNRISNSNWTPYLATYIVESNKIEKIYDDLRKKNFLPSTWPDLPYEYINCSDTNNISIKLRSTRFYLPVHQSLSKSFFKKFKTNDINQNNKLITTEWNNLTNIQWDSFLKTQIKSNLLQSWAYGEAKNKLEGWKPNRVLFFKDNQMIAFVQILEKRFFNFFKIYRINRGPVFITKDRLLIQLIIKQVLSFGNILKGKILSVSFELEKSNENIVDLVNTKLLNFNLKGYSTIYLDIKPPLDIIRSSLNGKWRNMLVYAEKQDLIIKNGKSEDYINWLCEIHEENMNKRGFKGISSALLKTLSNESNESTFVIVYKAFLQESTIAAVSIAYHGNSATYLTAWTNEDGRKTKSNYLLLWEVIKDLKNNNIEWFDLGGIDTEATPGITNFKNGFNGKQSNLVPSGWAF